MCAAAVAVVVAIVAYDDVGTFVVDGFTDAGVCLTYVCPIWVQGTVLLCVASC